MTLAPAQMCTAAGAARPLPLRRWHGTVDDCERRVLATVRPPVLDVGCGPGRHTEALALQGFVVLGIDSAPAAISAARARGAPVLLRSIFEPIPGEGRWRTALLLDGNVGIGGDPVTLLARVRTVLAPLGEVIVEVEGSGAPIEVETVRVERADAVGPWFRWARVAIDGVAGVAASAGFDLVANVREGDRWFARLRRN